MSSQVPSGQGGNYENGGNAASSTFNITTNAPNGTVYNGTFNSNTFHSGATGASQSAPVATGREHVKNGKSRSQSQGRDLTTEHFSQDYTQRISEPVAQDQAFDHMGRYYPAPLNIDHTVRYAEDQRRHISAEDIDPYVDPSGYSTRPSPDSWEADPTHYAQGDYFTYRGNEHPQPFIAQGRWVPAASPMPPQPQPYRNFTMPPSEPAPYFPQPVFGQYPPPQPYMQDTQPYSPTPTPGLTPGWDAHSPYSSAPHTPRPTHAMPAPVHPQGKPRTWTTGD
ncbi:hypothetical protein FA13DRAFT_1735854, partial [Coprinellus micaceus]